jgi:hypothetical protein
MTLLLRQKFKVSLRRHRILTRKSLNALSATLAWARYAVYIFTHAFQKSLPEVTSRDVDPIVVKVLLVRTSFRYDALHHKGLPHWRKVSFVKMHAWVVSSSNFIFVEWKQGAGFLRTALLLEGFYTFIHKSFINLLSQLLSGRDVYFGKGQLSNFIKDGVVFFVHFLN